MADLTERKACLNCGNPNPAHWTTCGNCGLYPWRAAEATGTEAASPELRIGAPAAEECRVVLPNFAELTLLRGERVTIGREIGDEVIDEALEPYLDVSRLHVSIEYTEESLVITDVGSSYGTWLEETRLEPGLAVSARLGQRLRLGKNCYLKVSGHGY